MKTTQTFGVRFIALSKVNNQNDAYIYARITVSKKVIDISLKKIVQQSLWDSKRNSLISFCCSIFQYFIESAGIKVLTFIQTI